MPERIERQKGLRFVRDILYAALEGAPDEAFENPASVLTRGGSLTLSLRIARAIAEAGYELVSSKASPVYQGGIRRRMELEDFLDSVLVAAGAATVRNARFNVQARDALAELIYDCLRRSRVVLRRRR